MMHMLIAVTYLSRFLGAILAVLVALTFTPAAVMCTGAIADWKGGKQWVCSPFSLG